LRDRFQLIPPQTLNQKMLSRGFVLESEHEQALPGGKAFWMGVYGRP
jgi:hypothetical protein